MPSRRLSGVVVSDKCDKTIVVRVVRTYRHPLFKKTVRRSKKYHVHDEYNIASVGDYVTFVECPPRSKNKCWNLVPKVVGSSV